MINSGCKGPVPGAQLRITMSFMQFAPFLTGAKEKQHANNFPDPGQKRN
jgi:hypothetical protein